jgi:hypothetical protein
MLPLYLALFLNTFNLFLDPNYDYLPSSSNWKENLIGIEGGAEYREDKRSNWIISLEYTGKNINDVFRFKGGFLTTSDGTVIISAGIGKDKFLTEKVFIATHFMPSFAFVKGDDFKNTANGIKFNIAVEIGVLLSQNSAVSLQWRHCSSDYSTLPNNGIESFGLKLKFAF